MNQPDCSSSIAADPSRDGERDARYLAYFDCFDRELFYEAHGVLERLWLVERRGPNGPFYKGLIQLAGAFVHLQKYRLRPAAALFRLAHDNLRSFSPSHLDLDVAGVCRLIEDWLRRLEEGRFGVNPLSPGAAPKCRLERSRNLSDS